MSEEGTTDTTVTETTTDTTPAVASPQSYIDSEGNFTEGWRDNYVPEDVRDSAIFDRTTSIQGMTKTLAHFERMKGADTMVKPSDSFGDEDWDDFHKAAGWTGEAIPMVSPEGLPDGIWNEDRATSFSEVFNKLRLTPSQQAGIVEAYNTDILQQVTDMGNNIETSGAQLKADLVSEWGNAYEQKKHLGNAAIEKGVDSPEHKERLVQKFGNDPDFIRFASNIGGNFSESGSIPTVAVNDTPADLQTQINGIMNSDAFMKQTHPEHKNTMATLARLHKEKAQVRLPA